MLDALVYRVLGFFDRKPAETYEPHTPRSWAYHVPQAEIMALATPEERKEIRRLKSLGAASLLVEEIEGRLRARWAELNLV